MKLKIAAEVYCQMLSTARQAAPLEACGLLAGTAGCAVKFYQLTNVDYSGEHFSMLPEEQFAAVKDMRAHGLHMLAVWHSHPDTPARMSDEDMRLAFTPDIVYVILSLAQPFEPDCAGYWVNNGQAERVEIELEGDDD